MVKKAINKRVNAVRNPVDLPPWWTLGTIAVVGVCGVALLVTSLTGGDNTASNTVPSFAVGAVEEEAFNETLPLDEPGAVTTPTPVPATGTDDDFTVTVAPGEPRIISRATSVLGGSLADDGNTVEIRSGNNIVVIPRNVLATATAGFWAGVDPKVAAGLPVGGGGAREVPKKNFENATLRGIELSNSGPSRWVFTGNVDKDGPGPDSGQRVTVTVTESEGGYVVAGG